MTVWSVLLAIVLLSNAPNSLPPHIPMPPAQPVPPYALHATLDPPTCYSHENWGAADDACRNALQTKTEKLILVWDWPGPAFSGCPPPIDGFRVYRVDLGHTLAVPPVNSMTCDPKSKTYSLATVAFLEVPRARECFDVVAVKGALESNPSNEFCVGTLIPLNQVAPH
jgi:hypothetical protein